MDDWGEVALNQIMNQTLFNLLPPTIVQEVRTWKSNPQLNKIIFKLERANKKEQFFNHCAEAMFASHLLQMGFQDIQVELPIKPAGKQVDFRVIIDGVPICFHNKRLNLDKEEQEQEDRSDISKKFPNLIPHPSFVIGKDCRRYRNNLLKDAYEQFMPGEINIIVVCGPCAGDYCEFESALFAGQQVRFTGFWHNTEHPESQCAIWFHYMKPDELFFRMIYRETADSNLRNLMDQVFPQSK